MEQCDAFLPSGSGVFAIRAHTKADLTQQFVNNYNFLFINKPHIVVQRKKLTTYKSALKSPSHFFFIMSGLTTPPILVCTNQGWIIWQWAPGHKHLLGTENDVRQHSFAIMYKCMKWSRGERTHCFTVFLLYCTDVIYSTPPHVFLLYVIVNVPLYR